MDPLTMALISAGISAAGTGMGMFGRNRPEKRIQLDRFTPDQGMGLDQLLSQGLQNTDMSALENRYMDMFRSQTAPSIAERFSSLGTGGSQRSSGYMSALSGAGADLGGQLAGLRSQLGMQQLQMGMQPRFENLYEPEGPGRLQQAGSQLAGLGASALGPSIGMMGQYKQARATNKASGATNDLVQQLIKALAAQKGV